MLKIVKVSRRALNEMHSKLHPASRRILGELPCSNLYLQHDGFLLVADDDVELRVLPDSQEPISIVGMWRSAEIVG